MDRGGDVLWTRERSAPPRHPMRDGLRKLAALEHFIREEAVVESRTALGGMSRDRQAGGFGLGQTDALTDRRARQTPPIDALQLVHDLLRVKGPIHAACNDQRIP